MPSGDIGETLREARERRGVTVEEVAERIRIQPRLLRALEAEEWDALPGEFYVARFLNTYGQYLGLDGAALVDQLRRGGAPAAKRGPSPVVRRGREPRVEPAPRGRGTGPARAKGGLGPGARRTARGGGISMRAVGAALILAAIVVGFIVVVTSSGSSSGGKSGQTPGSGRSAGGAGGKGASAGGKAGSSQGKGTAAGGGFGAGKSAELTIKTTAEVWVCLLNAKGNALVDGQVLRSGEIAGPFRSAGFTVALGNGSVEMKVDGAAEKIAPSSDPIGFKIGRHGGLTKLAEGQRPTCS